MDTPAIIPVSPEISLTINRPKTMLAKKGTKAVYSRTSAWKRESCYYHGLRKYYSWEKFHHNSGYFKGKEYRPAFEDGVFQTVRQSP
jgi:hypothetical protein